MTTEAAAGPRVDEYGARFELEDRRLRAVALVHELRRPRRVAFARSGGVWRLELPRPSADRLEYLLELTYRNGRRSIVPDPANPLRAPGPFGDKSVVEFPGYAPPEWVVDDEAAEGTVRDLPLESPG